MYKRQAVVFLSVAGLFAGVVFLPRYFQLIHGASATESGWQIMALLAGLIIGAIGAGAVVARTGHWKVLLLGGMVVGAAGMILLTGLEAETELPFVWGAMFLTGLGLGPITSVMTAVIQSTSPPEAMGVATSTLTSARQLGASVWLAIAGSYFTTVFDDRLPGALRGAGVPDELATGLTGGSGASVGEDTAAMGDIGPTILAGLPEEARATVEPFIGSIVEGLHQVVSVATGNVFWIGIGTITVAFLVLLPLREVPLPKRSRAATAEAEAEAADTDERLSVEPA